MPLGIKPVVDFAFKMIFGLPQNSAALIGLLNAILCLKHPITSVELLTPFTYQEFTEQKRIALDVRCRDSLGRLLNIEMQTAIYAGLLERLVYYACRMYVEQLRAGENYKSAAPSITICLLDRVLFRDTPQAHHRFQMLDTASGRELERAIEVHTVELRKYNLNEASIAEASKLEQWAFLLLRAQDYDAATLRRLLPGIEFEPAIQTIETISLKTEDRQMYHKRERAQRDYEWAISSAREEGIEKGKLAGKIQTLQELLGDEVTSDAQLVSCEASELAARIEELQRRLRSRPL